MRLEAVIRRPEIAGENGFGPVSPGVERQAVSLGNWVGGAEWLSQVFYWVSFLILSKGQESENKRKQETPQNSDVRFHMYIVGLKTSIFTWTFFKVEKEIFPKTIWGLLQPHKNLYDASCW